MSIGVYLIRVQSVGVNSVGGRCSVTGWGLKTRTHHRGSAGKNLGQRDILEE